MCAHVNLDYMRVYIAENLESYMLMHYDMKCFFFSPGMLWTFASTMKGS